MPDETAPPAEAKPVTLTREQALVAYYEAIGKGDKPAAKAINDKYQLPFSEGNHS